MTIRFYKKSEDYGEFSNFSDHPIQMEGIFYPTVEHYFQAMKFANSPHAERIRTASNPMEAKQLGQTREVPIRGDWEDVKIDVMRAVIRQKFATYPALRKLLLDTNDSVIIEASPSDYYWGSGKSGTGENWLGRVLMEVRDELRKSSSA